MGDVFMGNYFQREILTAYETYMDPTHQGVFKEEHTNV